MFLLFLLCFLIFCIRSTKEAISCILCVPVCAGGVFNGALLAYCAACISKCPMIWEEYCNDESLPIVINKFKEYVYFLNKFFIKSQYLLIF